MKFLVFDQEGMATALAWKLRLEGNDVRFLSMKQEGKEHLLNMVPLVPDLRAGVDWVGKDGYIICGDESDCTPLRKRGYRVYGGNAFTEKTESDRNFETTVARAAGILTPNCHHVKNVDEAIQFIKSHPDQWVLKQMGCAPKTWNFVGKEKDGSDVIDQLEWMKGAKEYDKLKGKCPFMLQEIVDGIEFATSAWWIGKDWKRREDGSVLVEVNREHKKSLDGDTGMTCGESGTVMRFAENTRLFEETLKKLTPILKRYASDVVINIDANCGIVEEDGKAKAYLFEFTPREGYPAQSLILHLLDMDAGKFFSDLIDGKQGGVKTKPYWGVVTVLGSGHFPQEQYHEGSFKDQPVIIPQWEKTIDENIHPLYLKYDTKRDFFRVADFYEWIVAVTHCEDSIADANRQCIEDMQKIVTRAPVYRHDIGERFEQEEKPKLEALGYL